MFYKFNSVSGRVVPSTFSAAYNPQGMRPLEDRPAFFQYDQKNTRPVMTSETSSAAGRVAGQSATMSTAASTTGAKPLGFIPTDPKYQRIIELQKLFTKDDGLLVWMKRGARDKAFVGVTVALCAVGLVSGFHTLYQMSRRKD